MGNIVDINFFTNQLNCSAFVVLNYFFTPMHELKECLFSVPKEDLLDSF